MCAAGGMALLAACAPSSGTSLAPAETSTASRPTSTQSSNEASDTATPQPSTGNPAYDEGYSFGQSKPPQLRGCAEETSERQAGDALNSVDQALAFLQGCWDGEEGISPDGKRAPRVAAADLPEFAGPDHSKSDACERGEPTPWVVVWGAPGTSGDVTVTAPCKADAKRQARSQIPANAKIIDIFRI